ncbi:MAG: C45 family peptidase [Planctomycetes bacterium]|nr:C45 family peptidase [Planctomycetota bacterium]
MRLPTRLSDRLANTRFLALAGEWLAGVLAASLPHQTAIASDAAPDAPIEARRAVVGGVVIASAGGSGAEIGSQLGARFRSEIGSLLPLMDIRSRTGHLTNRARWRALEQAVPERWREEIRATAAAAGVAEGSLIAANVLTDTQCSALVSPPLDGRPLMVARNMDFFPAAALGPGTVVMALRPAGRHAFVNVGWPGLAGVVSGMNDAGLTACVLLNHQGRARCEGMPVLFALRTLLEDCASLDQALAALAATPVASPHYILLADQASSALAWHDRDGFHSHRPEAGWLACSNGPRTADGMPDDDRGTRLRQLGRGVAPAEVDPAWMRRSLTATYLAGINAQAMLFVPATRRLELATGTGLHPAALQPWHGLDCAPLLAGGDPAGTTVADLPAAVPLPR